MRPVRRHDYSPRVEMMPLIDVVFLLLTFFIYAMVVLVQLEAGGLSLASVEGDTRAVTGNVILLVVDAEGAVLIDGVPVADDELDGRLRAIASRADAPPLVVTLQETETAIDRGPAFMRLLARIRQAGVRDIQLPKLDGGSGVSP